MYDFIFWYQIFNYVSCSAAILLNSLLLYLIKNHSHPEIGDFRIILMNTAITDLLLGVSLSAVQNYKLKHCGDVILIIVGYAKFLFGWRFCELTYHFIWIPLAYYSVACFPISFIFRYYALVSMNGPNLFTVKKLIFSFALAAVLASHFGLSSLGFRARYLYKFDDHSTCGQNQTSFRSDIQTVAFWRQKASDLTSWQQWLHRTSLSVIIFGPLTYALNAGFGFKTYGFLKGHIGSLSAATRRSAFEILKVAILQAVLPMLASLPTIIDSLLISIENSDSFTLRNYAVLIFCWLPAVDPIIPIYFLKSYREAFLKMFKLFC